MNIFFFFCLVTKYFIAERLHVQLTQRSVKNYISTLLCTEILLTLKRNKYNGSSGNGNVDHYHGMGGYIFS